MIITMAILLDVFGGLVCLGFFMLFLLVLLFGVFLTIPSTLMKGQVGGQRFCNPILPVLKSLTNFIFA